MTTNKQTEQWTPFDTDIDEFKAFKNINSNHTLSAARWYLQGKRDGYLEALDPTGVRDALEATIERVEWWQTDKRLQCRLCRPIANQHAPSCPLTLIHAALAAISGPG